MKLYVCPICGKAIRKESLWYHHCGAALVRDDTKPVLKEDADAQAKSVQENQQNKTIDVLYRGKDVRTGKTVCGSLVSRVTGGKPVIVTHAEVQDDGEVEFEYSFVDPDTIEKADVSA